jgi:hypothetical protein
MPMTEPLFKYRKLKDEFYNKTHKRVRETVLALAEYAYKEFSYHLVVTSVIRANSWMHSNGYAVDIRANDMLQDCVGNCISFTLTNYPRNELIDSNGRSRTALSCYAHGKGVTFHLHISQDINQK